MEAVVGMRVVRGPDWDWGDRDHDGGEGFVGTVVGLDARQSGVIVLWDTGHRCEYRCGGKDDKFDIRVLDTAQIGVNHGVQCGGCGKVIWGFLWRCVHCFESGSLCSECYMAGKHSILHSFLRIDTDNGERVKVLPRYISRAVTARGIFPGAVVVRGVDWRWADQDVQAGNLGEVTEIQNWKDESGRSSVYVLWRGKPKKQKYRLGLKGKVDLRCVTDASGGRYYPGHLPVLGAEQRVSTGAYAAGDQVKVALDQDLEEWKTLQQEHGGWEDEMAQYVGNPGLVQHITETGELIVSYPGTAIFPIHPDAVSKENVPPLFRVEDVVKINDDRDQVSRMQKGHGGWFDDMTESLGRTGRVVKVLPSGDAQVCVAGRRWVFNPSCLQPAPDEQADVEDKEIKLSKFVKSQLESLAKQSNSDVVVAASAAGDLHTLRNYLQQKPRMVNVKVKGKTGLMVATAEGWPVVVTTLLDEFEASVNETDGDGDTALHYCAHLDRGDIAKTLLDHGADPNVCNQLGLPPMFYAIALGNYGVLRRLIDSGRLNLNIQDGDDNTGLHVAVLCHRSEAVRMLLEEGATPDLYNHSHLNPILSAATTGFFMGLEQFIEKNRDQVISSRDEDGNTPLHIAAVNNHMDIVCLLCDMEACEVDATNRLKLQTPLHVAVCEGNTRIMERLLVQYHADPNRTDADGRTPLHLVIANKESMKTPSEFSPHTLQVSNEVQGSGAKPPENYIPVGCLLVKCRADYIKDSLMRSHGCSDYFVTLLATYTQKQ